MKVFHLSVECYPVAKVGGLADVVGALPKYQNRLPGVEASVVMPWYNREFVHSHDFELVFDGLIHQNRSLFQVLVYKETGRSLGFDLYLVKIPGLLDRDNPYGYWDESQQFMAFQHGVLHWMAAMKIVPDVLHCHDYHTGLVPFMVKYCPEFSALERVTTIGTIHNGEYQGQMHWAMLDYFPWVSGNAPLGLLDWDGRINPLAAMIKCCSAFNAVSTGYLEELFLSFRGLEGLVRQEHQKAWGIINGIDTEVWNPATDAYLDIHFTAENAAEGKQLNKTKLCRQYGLDPGIPLVAFIGRFAGEKGADLLPDIVGRTMTALNGRVSLMILGSGQPEIENALKKLAAQFPGFGLELGYKEALSHLVYAAADFLLMPSRVEPCGLNQLYAMRYGTVPVVRYTGGLRDTVQDVTSGGAGLNFTFPGAEDAVHAIERAVNIYHQKSYFDELVQTNMKFDFSWEQSAENYLNLYSQSSDQKQIQTI